MTLPVFVVDAFATGPFSGNPAAVIPLDEWLDSDLMQKIAQENNQAETAFILPIQGAWHIRWFTPTVEVNLCGHATMASAHVLRHHLGVQQDQFRFWSRSGWLQVNLQNDKYALDLPADELQPSDTPPFMFEALGIDVLEFWKGRDDFLALIGDADHLVSMQPDYPLLARLRGRGLIVTAQDEQHDFVSRCFYPQSGINEDPATGSAHTTLTRFWAKRLGQDHMTAWQASPRGALIECTLEKERVILTGTCSTYLEGRILL